MKRISVCVAAFALVLGADAARAVSIGIGAFGGVSIPVVQADNEGRGTVFGARVPVSVIRLVTVEPFFASTSGGDTKETFEGVSYTRTGLDLKAFGANAQLSFGSTVRIFPFAGIGSYNASRGGEEDTQTGYNFGLGLGFSPRVLGLSFDLRGELTAVVDGDVSRKWANVTAGVSYRLIRLPR